MDNYGLQWYDIIDTYGSILDLHLSLEILYIVILHDCHDSGLSWIIWHTMELECWMTQVGKLSFRLPAERRDWARPLGTQCVLFPVPASLFWFLLQIIDNGVYDAILLEITLQYHSIPLILSNFIPMNLTMPRLERLALDAGPPRRACPTPLEATPPWTA